MAPQPIFTGAATALITPLTKEGIDFEAYGKLIDWQIEQGIDALVAVGTTGEGATLDYQEHRDAIEFAVKRVAGRVPLIAGTGSNDTAHACDLTAWACKIGVDACLVVTPYYNKTTQRGLVEMFTAIADAATKPVILYNVPSRTGINIEPETFVALADHPMIAAIKEANGNISKIVEEFALVGDKLAIYSGNDDQVVPIMSMGGQGVISVLSNVAPAQTSKLCHLMLEGRVSEAAALQMELLPLCKALFCETNPIPVKAAMAAMGFCENYLRLPLVSMTPGKKQDMLAIMRDMGIL